MNKRIQKACAFLLLGTLSINSVTLMATPNEPLINTRNTTKVLAQQPNKANFSYEKYLAKFTYGSQLKGDVARIYKALTGLTTISETPIEIYLNEPKTFSTGHPDQTKWTPKEKAQCDAITKQIFDDVESALVALIKDYPEIFWLALGDNGCETQFNFSIRQNLQTGECKFTVNKITFTPIIASYYRDIPDAMNQVMEAVDNFNVEGTTTYEKVKSIHNQLCKQLTYKLDAPGAGDVYGALINKKCVCEGYAEAFKLLCDKEDIPCVLVIGDGITSSGKREGHMWNYVQMEDNKWYAMDVTWDDQKNISLYDYFLVGSQTLSSRAMGAKPFSTTHKPTGDFTDKNTYIFDYPILNEERYVPK